MGIRTRFILLSVLMACGTAIPLAGVLVMRSRSLGLTQIRRHALQYGAALAWNAEPAVLLNDHDALRRLLAGAAADKAVVACRIVGLEGRSIAETSAAGAAIGSFVPPCETGESGVTQLDDRILVTLPIRRSPQDLDLGLLEETPAASDEHLVGWIQIAFDVASFEADLKRSISWSIVVVASILLLSFIVTAVLSRQILIPLKDLVRTASSIEQGHLGSRAAEHAPAEFGALARVFNCMASTLQQHTTALEQQVAERTAQLQAHARTLECRNEELKRATEQAQAASRAKSQFLANMSHEIRTPMTAILGFADRLCEPDLDSDQRLEASATIRRNGEHLLGVISDILDVSRIEAGKLAVETVACSPAQIVCEVASLCRPRAIDKQVRFVTCFETALPQSIRTDPMRLRQILMNLVGNAVKFTRQGEVRFAVRYEPADASPPGSKPPDRTAAGGQVEFIVTDTGPGIDPAQIEGLFQPFHQADSSMTRRYGGTGLGLAISRRLAELLGGRIRVDSAVGRGSTFALVLPACTVEGTVLVHPLAESCDTRLASPPAALEMIEPLVCRILLAEDGPDNQRLISAILRKAGACVDVAENGRVAVEKIATADRSGQQYDLVIMDMQMPELDGYEATRHLRRTGCKLPILALTAHAMSEDRAKCLAAGCDDYDTKPIRRDHLLKMIRSHLRPTVAV